MSYEEPKPGFLERGMQIYVALSVAALVLGVFLALLYGHRAPKSERTLEVENSDPLVIARTSLKKTTDLSTCRSVIQQVNLYLSDHPKQKPPSLTAEQRAFLRETCLADPAGEMTEVEGGAFTVLDAHHLSECFLFRDAAESIDVNGLPAAEQAEAAFRWTVRQIRLRDPLLPDSEPLPPEFVLRRGWGTALERAFVFLALLRQMGIEGCVIATPAGDGQPFTWACGALVEVKENEASARKNVVLFDHRMGIPLPGPKGKGIATLADLHRNPDQLKALTVNPASPYDVTPEQVGGAEILLIEPLSALSLRMAVLQRDLLGPSVKGRLAADPKESLDRFAEAAKPLHVPVRVANRWTSLLRRFLPADEGGCDRAFSFPLRSLPGFLGRNAENLALQMTRKKLYELQLAAWSDFPEQARELPSTSDLGQRPRSIYGQLFLSFYLEPRRPRDLVLRGRYDEAVGALSAARDKYDANKKRLSEALAVGPDKQAGLDKQLNDWVKQAYKVYGDLALADQKGGGGAEGIPPAEAKRQVEALWKDAALPLVILIEGHAAKPLDAESTYLIALAWHEQASHIQVRIDRDRRQGRANSSSDVAAARAAWQTALSWWRTLSSDPAASCLSPVMRAWEAEAFQALGEGETARALLQDLSGELTPLEKTARLYLASQVTP